MEERNRSNHNTGRDVGLKMVAKKTSAAQPGQEKIYNRFHEKFSIGEPLKQITLTQGRQSWFCSEMPKIAPFVSLCFGVLWLSMAPGTIPIPS